MSYIAKAIEKGLKKKRLSQKELAKILGVSPPNVNQWVKGITIPSGDKLLKVIEVLDIVSEFFPNYTQKGTGDDHKTTQEIQKIWQQIDRLRQGEREEATSELKPKDDKKRILVIEDDPFIPVIIKNTFIAEGYKNYEFLATPSAMEALNIIEENPISLIVLDLLMPVVPGLEFLKMLRENPEIKNIPLIIMTGADDDLIKEASRYKPDVVIKKPFEYLKFKKALEKVALDKH